MAKSHTLSFLSLVFIEESFIEFFVHKEIFIYTVVVIRWVLYLWQIVRKTFVYEEIRKLDAGSWDISKLCYALMMFIDSQIRKHMVLAMALLIPVHLVEKPESTYRYMYIPIHVSRARSAGPHCSGDRTRVLTKAQYFRLCFQLLTFCSVNCRSKIKYCFVTRFYCRWKRWRFSNYGYFVGHKLITILFATWFQLAWTIYDVIARIVWTAELLFFLRKKSIFLPIILTMRHFITFITLNIWYSKWTIVTCICICV